MIRMRRVSALAVGLSLAVVSVASAQSLTNGNLFVQVNVGGQAPSRKADNLLTVPVYGQEAAVATTITVPSGAIFDLSAGYNVRKSIGVAVGVSTFSHTGRMAGAASVPSPIFFNRPLAVGIPESSAKRSDVSVSVLLVHFMPIIEKVDLELFIGPSFTHVKQTLIGTVSIPAGTQDVVPTIDSQSGTATGINLGADLSYMYTKQVGGGIFMRYIGGSVDLESAKNLKAGGFQVGIGARLRF